MARVRVPSGLSYEVVGQHVLYCELSGMWFRYRLYNFATNRPKARRTTGGVKGGECGWSAQGERTIYVPPDRSTPNLVAPFQFPFGLPIVSDDPWIYFPIQVARCWVGTAAGNDTRLLKSGTVLVQSPAASLRDGCSQRQNSTASGRRKVAVEEYPRTWD